MQAQPKPAAPPGKCCTADHQRKTDGAYGRKNVIAKAAASLIQDGQCIFLDGGTSVAQLIDFIQDKRIKIVTPNLLIPRKLYNTGYGHLPDRRKIHAFPRKHRGAPTPKKSISQFHFDYAFFGCSGIELNNQLAYNDDIETVPVKEVAMRCADKSVLLADSSKIGKTSLCPFTSLSSFDNIIIYEPENLSIGFPSNFTHRKRITVLGDRHPGSPTRMPVSLIYFMPGLQNFGNSILCGKLVCFLQQVDHTYLSKDLSSAELQQRQPAPFLASTSATALPIPFTVPWYS